MKTNLTKPQNPTQKILGFVLALSFWLYVAALPPFRIGIWVDAEFVLIASHGLFALVGVILVALSITEKKLSCSKHTILLIGFSLFSLVATLWAKNPILHHFGVPILGEGTILFFGISLLSLGFDNVLEKNWMYFSSVIAGIVAGVLTVLHHPLYGFNIDPNWLPYVFCAFLAPFASGILAITTVIDNKKLRLSILLVCTFLFYQSHNRTAWVAIAVGYCFWMIFQKTRHILKLEKYLCISLPLIISVAIYLLPTWFDFASLQSRKLGIQSYIIAWSKAHLSLFYGNGWAYYYENLQKNLTNLPVKLYENGIWKPSWDGIDRIDFHCMHMGLECLFSVGIGGVIFYASFILAGFPSAPKKNISLINFIFVILFCSLTSTWFTMITIWPFFILGFSILNTDKIFISQKTPLLAWLSLAIILCGHGAFTYWKTAILYPINPSSLFYQFANTSKRLSVEDVKAPYNYRGFHLGHWILNITKKNSKDSAALQKELKFILSIYDEKNSPLLLDSALLRGMLHINTVAQNPLHLLTIVRAVLQKAPERADLVVPCTNNLI